MTLITDHRPRTLDDVTGNEEVIQSLKSILAREREKLPHVFLFSGPAGCGKTTLARIVAREVGCSEQDIDEIDSAQYTGVDSIRDLRQRVRFVPIDGEVRAVILDECHRLTGNAQDALLKVLEDTPPHVFFVLCTTDLSAIRAPVQRRCALYEVRPLSERQLIKLLLRVTEAEGAKVPKDVLMQIATDSMCQPGLAISILDKVIGLPEADMLAVAKRQAETQSQVIELCRALMRKDNWKAIAEILRRLEDDPESIRRAVLGYCNAVLTKQDNPLAFVIMDEFVEPFFQSGRPGLTVACYRVVKGG